GPRGELAAPVSRHGPDRRLDVPDVRGGAAGVDVAAGVSLAAGALAVGHPRTSRHGDGGAELRLRAVRAESAGGASRGAGPLLDALHAERSRTGESGDARTVRRAL